MVGESNPIKSAVIEAAHFSQLLAAISKRGYELFGPTVCESAIVYDRISSVADLPTGWTDEQTAGGYRLVRRNDQSFFGYNVGPHSWKRFVYPPEQRLVQLRREDEGFRVVSEAQKPGKRAFIGARACELRALSILDKVFAGGPYTDAEYNSRRANLFIVGVNCAQAGGTCFCASMNAGPRVSSGYDLALTEVVRGEEHHFVVDVGSRNGAEVVAEIPHRDAGPTDDETVDRIIASTTTQMGRTMDVAGLKGLLYANYEHPRWDEVAQRCLTCANCTMVCPTCFCATVEDTTDLTGENAERWRKWDSCFTMDFSYIHGGSVRATPKSRYRQWMTHKLATWVDQFGEIGCVGCGRCLTWCPVGIDITEEVRAIQASDSRLAHAKERTP